jgi:hypothetical protein
MLAGLYYVNCSAFKERLAAVAESVVVQLLEQVRTAQRNSNVAIFESYQVTRPCRTPPPMDRCSMQGTLPKH